MSSTSMTADYHMHTPLCRHAEGWPDDYAAMAFDRALPEIGFSDHNPMPHHFDDWRMDLSDFPEYLDCVAGARADWDGRLSIRLGLECDFLPGQEGWIDELAGMAYFDYLIGAVHYITDDWAVDDPDPRWLLRWEGHIESVWEAYWERFRQCAASELFDFLAHPDLVKKFGHRPAGDLRRFYEPAIEVMAKHGQAYEISTAGLRKPCRELYPAPEFIRLACEAGIPVVISSDSHRPEEVGSDFEVAIRAALDAGYTETLRFAGRERTMAPLESLAAGGPIGKAPSP